MAIFVISAINSFARADIDILARAIVDISQLAYVTEIKEAEINPIVIKAKNDGIVAVDGLITLN